MATETRTADATQLFTVDPERSEVTFSWRHIVFAKVEGHAKIRAGLIRYDADHPVRSSATVVISAASVTTGDPERDDHVRSPEFLDVERYPEIRFESRRLGVTTAPITRRWSRARRARSGT